MRASARSAALRHGLSSSSFSSRLFSTTRRRQDYASTLPNLRIGSKTRVMFQGFTGRQATANAQESMQWGTNIVGGVTPGREGEHLGLPVLPTVRRAVEVLRPDATAIYVPASGAAAAIEEAVEAEVPLVVAVAEHVPLHDVLRIRQVLRTQSRSRLVGPNSPGIISAARGERCRIGFQPLPCFSAGCVGIAARSGTLSYEAVASTTRAGLGQSLVVGVGGDVLPGTDIVEALQVLETDPATRAMAIIGEIGGDAEILAAMWVRDYHRRTPEAERKPIVALVAGRYAPWDRVMGHSGAFWLPGEPDAEQKIEALRLVGVPSVNHPSKIGEALKVMLQEAADRQGQRAESAESAAEKVSPGGFANAATASLGKNPLDQQQTRGLHTSTPSRSLVSRSRSGITSRPWRLKQQLEHTRGLHLDREASLDLMREQSQQTKLQTSPYPLHYVGLSIDRTTATQCIVSAFVPDKDTWRQPQRFNKILLPPDATDFSALSQADKDAASHALFKHLNAQHSLFLHPNVDYHALLQDLLIDLSKLFTTNEATLAAVHLSPGTSPTQPLRIQDMRIELDDGSSRPGARQAALHKRFYGSPTATAVSRDPGAAEAAVHGIVYHRLRPSDPSHDIGTLVNGAGLAMNTIDALRDAGGLAANFLDTGGKATADTVRRAFEVILRDERVRVVMVNIFGGLTRGDVIARGVLQAFGELAVRVPVVVRIRGTNEAEGQEIIASSGLPLYAFDDFDEAAAKAVELASEARAREQAGGGQEQQQQL